MAVLRRTLTRLSRCASFCNTRQVPSSLASSTMISSRLRHVWANIDRAAAAGQEVVAGIDMERDAFELRIAPDGSLAVKATRKPEGDFLLRGNGNTLARAVYGPEPVARLAEAGVMVETMSSPAAARSFNVTLAEGRRVACALLPV